MSESSQPNDEFMELIRQYEAAREENRTIYLDSDDYCDIANYYLKEEMIEDAHEAVARGLSIHSNLPELLAIQTTLYVIENKLDKAREAFNFITDSQNIYVKTAEIELLIQEGNEDKAQELLETIHTEDAGSDPSIVLAITYFYSKLGLTPQGLQWIDSFTSAEFLKDPEILEVLAECYGLYEKHQEASKLYNQLLDIDPYNSDYWLGLATSQFQQENFDKAIEACDFALVSNENNGEAHTIKGNSFFQLGNYETAMEEYKSGDLAPEYLHIFTGYCQVGLQNYEAALNSFTDALPYLKENDSLNAHALLNSAKCLWGLNRFEEAYQYCLTLQEHFPNLPDGYLLHGEFLMKEEKVEEALQKWEKALSISNSMPIWYQMGVASFNAGYYKDAEPFFIKIEEVDDSFEDLNKYFTLIYLYTGNEEKFTKYWKKFLKELDIDSSKVTDLMTFFELLDEDIQNITQEAQILLSKFWNY